MHMNKTKFKKKQFSCVLSNDLYWENKTYQLKRRHRANGPIFFSLGYDISKQNYLLSFESKQNNYSLTMIFSNELFIMAISMFKATITVQITYAIKNRRPKADVRRNLGSLTAISPSSTRPSNNQNMANKELGWLGMKRKMEMSNPFDTGTKGRVSVLSVLTKRVMLFIISKKYRNIEREYKEIKLDIIALPIPASSAYIKPSFSGLYDSGNTQKVLVAY